MENKKREYINNIFSGDTTNRIITDSSVQRIVNTAVTRSISNNLSKKELYTEAYNIVINVIMNFELRKGTWDGIIDGSNIDGLRMLYRLMNIYLHKELPKISYTWLDEPSTEVLGVGKIGSLNSIVPGSDGIEYIETVESSLWTPKEVLVSPFHDWFYDNYKRVLTKRQAEYITKLLKTGDFAGLEVSKKESSRHYTMLSRIRKRTYTKLREIYHGSHYTDLKELQEELSTPQEIYEWYKQNIQGYVHVLSSYKRKKEFITALQVGDLESVEIIYFDEYMERYLKYLEELRKYILTNKVLNQEICIREEE